MKTKSSGLAQDNSEGTTEHVDGLDLKEKKRIQNDILSSWLKRCHLLRWERPAETPAGFAGRREAKC